MKGHLTRSGVYLSNDIFVDYGNVTCMVKDWGTLAKRKNKHNLSKYQRQIIAPKEFFLWDAKPTLSW
jgi:hypothetical protein